MRTSPRGHEARVQLDSRRETRGGERLYRSSGEAQLACNSVKQNSSSSQQQQLVVCVVEWLWLRLRGRWRSLAAAAPLDVRGSDFQRAFASSPRCSCRLCRTNQPTIQPSHPSSTISPSRRNRHPLNHPLINPLHTHTLTQTHTASERMASSSSSSKLRPAECTSSTCGCHNPSLQDETDNHQY